MKDNTTVPVGNASTLQALVGKQEMQRILTGRESHEEKERTQQWHLYRERGTQKLFLRQSVADTMEYIQEVVNPVSLETAQIASNSTLDLLSKLPAYVRPPILEEPCTEEE